ncbi:MAG: hypothetical protein JWM05_3405, partial [Acidimicrobiales bacterium]|nr:hypothetical protein [Acidimicrobiales bacterium]
MSDLPSDELRGRSRGADVDVDAAPSREQLSHGGARADELSARCAELEAAVDALRLQVAVRERLLTMVAAGGGRAGIARGVHEVTGLPVAVEDSYGNLGARAGPGRPDPYPKASPAERDDLLHRAGARRSWREDGRLVALAR